jgi:type IV secretory pathway VirJ component
MFCGNKARMVRRIIAGLFALAGAASAGPQSLNYGRFGEISIYRSSAEPRELVLFVSGDGGWNLGVIAMAERLAGLGAVVAGVDIRHYLAELEKSTDTCVAPASDLENLSRELQAQLGIKPNLKPTLIGYSSGATLVYAALVEAQQGVFKGSLSIGFCPDLDLKRTLCKGSGIEATPRHSPKGALQGVDLLPAKTLHGRWISLQGEIDQVCPAAQTQDFIAKVPGAEIVLLPKVGHGYSVEKNWLPQFEAAFGRLTAVSSGARH